MKDLVNLPSDELKRAPGIKKVTKLPLDSFRFCYENLEPLLDFLIEQQSACKPAPFRGGGGGGGERDTVIILVQGFAGMCCVKTSQAHEIIIPMV